MDKPNGKVVVITGASRGIGRDMALVFAREGAKVVVSARTEQEGDTPVSGSIQSTLKLIREAGGEAIGVRCDVTDETQVEALMQRTLEHYGQIDILVNNAAVLVFPGKIEEISASHWDSLCRVNIYGPFFCCKFALPYMKRQGWGHIINISAGGGSGGPGPGPYTTTGTRGTAYSASKAHLNRFTQGLAHEVWQDGVGVNSLSPKKGIASEGVRWFMEAYLGRREDGQIMGDAAVYICAQDPRTYTGRILYDEDVLSEAGVTDFSMYPVIPASPS
ncbi:MAG: SDR family NAD(P)-dependent oxidoreductase [Dehalococcoidia bacterium]|jgi:citronellol/citronellal dehydrogenase|nr:SDR family NAD(P)-dependent oxidoreductase [Dehalococcoidia bacterium]